MVDFLGLCFREWRERKYVVNVIANSILNTMSNDSQRSKTAHCFLPDSYYIAGGLDFFAK